MYYSVPEIMQLLARHGVTNKRDAEKHKKLCVLLKEAADMQVFYIDSPEELTAPVEDSHLFAVVTTKSGVFSPSIADWALLIVERMYGQHVALYGKCTWDLQSSTDT